MAEPVAAAPPPPDIERRRITELADEILRPHLAASVLTSSSHRPHGRVVKRRLLPGSPLKSHVEYEDGATAVIAYPGLARSQARVAWNSPYAPVIRFIRRPCARYATVATCGRFTVRPCARARRFHRARSGCARSSGGGETGDAGGDGGSGSDADAIALLAVVGS